MPVYQPDVELFEQGVQHPRVKLQIHILGQIGQESADAHGGIQSLGVGGGREERVVCAECNNQLTVSRLSHKVTHRAPERACPRQIPESPEVIEPDVPAQRLRFGKSAENRARTPIRIVTNERSRNHLGRSQLPQSTDQAKLKFVRGKLHALFCLMNDFVLIFLGEDSADKQNFRCAHFPNLTCRLFRCMPCKKDLRDIAYHPLNILP